MKYNYHNELQHSGNYEYELGPLGLPFHVDEGQPEPSPLNKSSLNDCIANSTIWVCENNHWSFYKFQCVWDTSVALIDTLGKCQLFDLNNLPLMYLQPIESDIFEKTPPKEDVEFKKSKEYVKKRIKSFGVSKRKKTKNGYSYNWFNIL